MEKDGLRKRVSKNCEILIKNFTLARKQMKSYFPSKIESKPHVYKKLNVVYHTDQLTSDFYI